MPLLLAVLLACGTSSAAQRIEIVNEHGSVGVEVVADNRLQVWREGQTPTTSEGITVSRSRDAFLVEALPPEDDNPAILVRVPLHIAFSVRTTDGDIAVTGMARRARVQSLRGSLTLTVPLETTVLNLESTERPARLDLDNTYRLRLMPLTISRRLRIWKLAYNLRSDDLAYGLIEGQLHSPPSLTVRDWKFPPSWPVKPHTHSAAAIKRLLGLARKREERLARGPEVRRPPRRAPAQQGGADTALFTSDVRMVNLSVAVSDGGGRPLMGLGREDFAVEEDGDRQDIRVVDPEESPFNLAILLDLSGSTSVDLEHMRQATLRLIELADANDRVALYAMAGSMFHRLTPLTRDREALLERAWRLPYPSGGSPLWDAIALAYDDELAGHPGERNALVVISDGIDNRISGQSVPSKLRSAGLVEAAGEMDARIYPIFLLSGERFKRNWSVQARKRMEALARKSGGRLFTARSVADVEPVLPQLAEELRSIYEIAYYPRNQDFDGGWRRVRVAVRLPGAQVRARPGYFAE